LKNPFSFFKLRTLRFWDYWFLSRFGGRVLSVPRGRQKAVVLSFDVETWDEMCGGEKELSANAEEEYFKYLPRLLATLDKYSAKAQFFVCGKVLELYSDAFEEVVRKGHGVGGHGYYHENMSRLSGGLQKRIVDMVKHLLYKKLGIEMRSWRCPGLAANFETYRVLNELGVKYASNCYRVKPFSIKGVLEVPLSGRMDDYILGFHSSENASGLWSEYMKRKILTSHKITVFGMHTWIRKYDPECKAIENILDYIGAYERKVWVGRFDDFEESCV